MYRILWDSAELSAMRCALYQSIDKNVFKYRGQISDALGHTTETGYYAYSFNTTNAPTTDPGWMICFNHTSLWTMRLCMTTTNRLFVSVYQSGTTYGVWKEIL